MHVRGADRPRLSDLTLDIQPGRTAILGPSGAGKTTLLNLLVGFETPDAGAIVCELKPQASSHSPPVFWCPPDHGLWPQLTTREHLRAAACQDFRERTEGMLQSFDLLECADARPDHLSQGQRSRLSVARALVTGAQVLVMDEPLVHVDEPRVPRYWGVIRKVLEDTGASLVFATHDSTVAREHAQRAVRLEQGRIVSDAPPARGNGSAPGAGMVQRLALLLVLGLAMWGCDESAEAALPVEQVIQHSLPNDAAKVPAPRDIAPGEGGELLVIDNAARILVIDQSGAVLRQWRTPTNDHGNPEGICQLRDGRIAVADTHYFRVLFFDRDGKLLSTLGEEGDGPGQFRYPVKIAEDDVGNLYVAEYGGNDRIQKFTAGGKHLMSIGSFGTGEGEFQRPSGLLWHDGRLYIADAINNRLLIYSDDGKYLGVLAADVPLKLPYDLSLGRDGRFYVIEYQAGRLTVIDEHGQLVGRFDGGPDHRLRTPWGLAVDDGSTVWIADTGHFRMLEVRQ